MKIRERAVTGNSDYVVLLHGFNDTHKHMLLFEKRLHSQGYHVLNIDYPSHQLTIEDTASAVADVLSQRVDRSRRMHFVTHSMGGVVTRCLLERYPQTNLGRVVMMSPPHHGSEWADLAGKINIPDQLRSKPILEMRTSPDSFVHQLGEVDYELGIIGANRHFGTLTSPVFSGENDGVVSIESMKVSGMKDFIVLRKLHITMVFSPKVIRQTTYFLQHGQFDHPATPAL